MKCVSCNSTVPEAAKFCPECGNAIRQSVAEPVPGPSPGDWEPHYQQFAPFLWERGKPSSKGSKVFLGAIIIFLLLLYMSQNPTPGGNQYTLPPSSSRISMTGEEGHLVCWSGESMMALGATADDYDALSSARVGNDRYGVLHLLTSGKVFVVPCGTKILLLSGGWLMVRQVRILEGDHIGAEGWTYVESVQK